MVKVVNKLVMVIMVLLDLHMVNQVIYMVVEVVVDIVMNQVVMVQ
tara:strand:- start:184 stop:318 length:135 start_codon:yes stop_codon:yes gene_type:complete